MFGFQISDKPDNISSLLVLSSRVHYCYYCYGSHVTDVIVDQELEVLDVDQREISGEEILVRARPSKQLVRVVSQVQINVATKYFPVDISMRT